MATNSEKVKELLERAEQGIKDVFESDNYKDYLTTMSKFHSYSFRNSLLILLQKPAATHVAGYGAWQKKFNRHVQKGEKGIQIIGFTPRNQRVEQEKRDAGGNTVYGADGKPVTETVTKQVPAFMPVYVFDVSQTEGEPLPELVYELDGSVEAYQDLFRAISEVSPFRIEFEDIRGGARGYCDPEAQKIAIQQGMGERQTIKTAIHEITHADLHAPEQSLAISDRTDRRTREVEAESIAFVVCSHYGIDTSDYSFPYLASWSSDKELKELQSSLDTIQKQAGDLIDRIDNRLAELQKGREAEIFTEVTPEKVQELVAAFDAKEDRENGRYLAVSDGKFIAVDDSTGNCWVEEFSLRKEAVSWLKGEYEMSEYHDRQNPDAELPPPDPGITIAEMEQYGFQNDTDAGISMLPMERAKAGELLSRDITVYMLYSDNSAVSVDNISEIEQHGDAGGIFGVKSEDWEQQGRFESRAQTIAQKYIDFVEKYDKSVATPHPFSITDPAERLNIVTDRIMQYNTGSFTTIVDFTLSSMAKNDNPDYTQALREFQGIVAEQDAFTQDKLALEVNHYDGEPVVFIRFSESDRVAAGQVYSLHEEKRNFKEADAAHEGDGYDKTAFTIKYQLDGQYGTYEGRQDFGDKDGGLIDHIKTFWTYELSDDMKGQHISAGHTDLIERAENALTDLVPYLQTHDVLGRMEDKTLELIGQYKELTAQGVEVTGGATELAYNEAFLSYINDCRSALNNGAELPEQPQREAYGLLPVEQMIDSRISAEELQEMRDYAAKVREEVAQEAADAGITVQQYLDAGSEPPADRHYTIYQLKAGDENHLRRFASLSELQGAPDLATYDRIYDGDLKAGATLGDLYTEFNINRPEDFKGHSLSISDLVVIEYNGAFTANYVDRYGFQNLPELAEQHGAIVGEISFASGEVQRFTDQEQYIAAIKEELPYQSTSGFSYKTFTRDPQTRKSIDDMLYDMFGENNPHSIEHYQNTAENGRSGADTRGGDGVMSESSTPIGVKAEQGHDHLASLIHDNDIDLDREKTREQLGFKDGQQQGKPDAGKRMSMKDRFAAAEAEAERRAAERSGKQQPQRSGQHKEI